MLRNRIALPATTTNYGASNRVTDRWIDFLAERAKGGAGLVITEIIAVDPAALCQASTVTGYEAENEDGFKRTAEAVEGEGACLIAQLWHPGRQQLWSPVASPKGISDQPDAYSWTVPHVMSTAELRQVAEEYVAVAKRFKRCGFGGVELHGAHGYLITQILSPWSNRRTDDYGGSLENRMRFALRVTEAVREVWPAHLPLFFRISATDWQEGGWDLAQSIDLARRLKSLGVDVIDVSSGGTIAHPKIPVGPGYQVPFAAAIREQAGIATAALGMITDSAQAETILATGQADFVVLAREMLRDPYFPRRAAQEMGVTLTPPVQYQRAW
jgi:2,4-dienoyl-CoA reductase-like NADH-dependent reductase (Old Yellow Enzyme family)